MKIAIVAPSPVPFTIGGAENLWWGLLNHINQQTPFRADLIKLPSPEGTFWELIDSYKRFSHLDLSHFDAVISGKYPGWMIQHPHHICYMLHRLRGLYDTYHFYDLPKTYTTRHPGIRSLQEFMNRNQRDRMALVECFERLEGLRALPDVSPEAFQFPGPLIREIIHFLDGIGLSTTAVEKFAAISRNVSMREDYFPTGKPVEVIYPPSNLKSFEHGTADYLFTVSRLDATKRVNLLIEAMKHVKADVQLRIAGSGPEDESFREMARDDKRILFLGTVNDRAVVDLYANALAVPYVPYDEDYGLVTIEAMMSSKPVLTTTDSGGPNEFVVDGETGFSVPPDPYALAERIDYLCTHPDETRDMGRAARKLVENITWENTVSKLLGLAQQSAPERTNRARKKITVALSFPVFPPRNGGQCRIFNLYSHLARQFNVELITFTGAGEPAFREEIAPGLREIRIAKSVEHEKAEADLSSKVNWVVVTDVAMPKLYSLTPAYLAALKESAESADYVVASHPYLLPAIQEVSDKPIWYEAHNVEVALKKSIIPPSPIGRELLRLTKEVESRCCEVASLITVCSANDGDLLHQIYNADPGKIVEVPNGVDSRAVTYIPLAERARTKETLGINNSLNALFIGSWHGPNIDAVRHILEFAKELPEVAFVIVGGVGGAFQHGVVPANVGFMGIVDDATKEIALSMADLALNPMEAGSGTNLKILEYCASGIPVISTRHGARGLALEHEQHIEIAEINDFPKAICRLRQKRTELDPRMASARNLVAARYDWAVIAGNFVDELARREAKSLTN